MGNVVRQSAIERMAHLEALYTKTWMEIHCRILKSKIQYKKMINKQPQNHKRTNHYKLNTNVSMIVKMYGERYFKAIYGENNGKD